jgi:redox-sensitive bicupin YhaK (pirin superfamily)
VLHRDSLGSEQVIRSGALNLMTAGAGVSHAEETSGISAGVLHGVQLWIAQPSATRHGDAAFEHHPELPRVDLERAAATVLTGTFLDAASPARHDTDLVAVELELPRGRTAVPLDRSFEYGLVALDGTIALDGQLLDARSLGYLGEDRETIDLDASDPVRALLIGGPPFPEPLMIWWNYVARTRSEISAAHRAWSDGDERFGTVASSLPRMAAPGPPWA